MAPVLPIPAWGTLPPQSPIRRPASAVGARVPYQYLGLARDIRRRIDKDALAWGGKADALLKPFKTGVKRSKVDLVRLFHRWKKLPSAGRLGALTIALEARGLELEEVRLYPGVITQSRWGEADEDTVDIRRVRFDLGLASYVGDVQTVVSVGLHALARRIERGTTAGLAPILADLQTLAESYRRIIEGPNSFRIPVSSGGHWRGVIMRSPDGRPQLTVRTFVGERE